MGVPLSFRFTSVEFGPPPDPSGVLGTTPPPLGSEIDEQDGSESGPARMGAMQPPVAFEDGPSRAGARPDGSGELGTDVEAHVRHGDHPWAINVPDHPKRKESAGFRASKVLAKKILATLGVDEHFYGTDSIQMHHGGSLWLFDDEGWFMVQNEVGIEWSGQFCTDPAKADELRQNAMRLYRGFPAAIPEMVRLGYKRADKILRTPISDSATIATWVDSIFNSCVALPAVRHTGVLPKGGGRHHYPTPITDIELVKHDDFVLWVTDPASGQPAAVVPVAKRGAGVAKVQLLYASPGTDLETKQEKAAARGRTITFADAEDLTQQAFRYQ